MADALLAWLLLGWLGQRLGWGVASGVLPVVLWWSVRALGRTAGTRRRSLGSPRFAALAAVAVVVAITALLWWVPAQHEALPILLGASLAWGAWSAWLAAATDAEAPARLPEQAMGFMMGSLWLGNLGCLNPGWSSSETVALHLALMAGVPWLLVLLRRVSQQPLRGSSPQWLALLAAGALLMAWQDQAAGRLAGMVLVVLAWSLATAARSVAAVPSAEGAPPALLGPALLLLVGLLAPRLGPEAAQATWGLFGLLAIGALAWGQRTPVLHPAGVGSRG